MNTSSPFDLSGTTVLVTGGSGFLGGYFVRALNNAGARVTITYLNNKDDAEKLGVFAVQMDTSDKASVQKGFQAVVEEHGRLDVLVNNAAIDPKFSPDADPNDKLFEYYPVELLKKSLDVNVLGYILPSQEAVKHMKENGGGIIINISSIYGLVGPDQRIYPEGTQKPVDYAVTKGAVNMLTKWLATTYGTDGIRANTLTFGGVMKGHGKEFTDKYSSRAPLGRMMNPEEVGGPLVFLTSDAASYMTGSNLVVDGGWTAW